MSAADSRGSMGRKPHYDVSKTDAQPSPKGMLKHEMSEDLPGGNVELKTPSGFLSGLKGILADHSANPSDSTLVGLKGPGSTTKTQSSRKGIEEGKPYPYPTGPDTTVASDSDNENFGAHSSNNIKNGKGPKQPKTHKWE